MGVQVSIQARMGSTRLPGKVLLPLGERRVLGWVVERCSNIPAIDGVMLTTGDRPENEAIQEWGRRNDVRCLSGPEEDLLERHRLVAKEANARTVVRITADCPFVPSSEIERVVSEHHRHQDAYMTNVTDRMPIGTGVDVIDTDLLESLSERGETHPVMVPRSDPGSWQTRFSSNPKWAKFADAHVAVDTPSDYWTLVDAVEAVGTDPLAVTEWVSTEG